MSFMQNSKGVDSDLACDPLHLDPRAGIPRRARKSQRGDWRAYHRYAKAIGSATTAQQIMDRALEGCLELAGAEGGVIHRLDRISRSLVAQAKRGVINGQGEAVSLDAGTSLLVRCLQSGLPLTLGFAAGESDGLSHACVPLILAGEAVGTILVHRTPSSLPFDPQDLEVMASLADLAMAALVKVEDLSQSLGDVAEARRRAALVRRISLAVRQPIRLSQRVHTLLEQLTSPDGLGARSATVFIIEELKQHLWGKSSLGPSFSLGLPLADKPPVPRELPLCRRCLRSPRGEGSCGWPVSICETLHRDSGTALCLEEGRSLVIPLAMEGQPVGLMILEGPPLLEGEEELMALLAEEIALALDHGRHYEAWLAASWNLEQGIVEFQQMEVGMALDQMARQMAHQLRNPLMPLGAFARSLSTRMAPGSEEQDTANRIYQLALRLEEIVKDFERFVTILDNYNSPSEAQPFVDINGLIKESVSLLAKEAESLGVVFSLDLDQHLPSIRAIADQFQLVILCLLSNAFQAVDKGGGTIHITTSQRDDHLVLSLRDTGGGIPVDLLPNVFNPFFSTDDSKLGLGLSMVHRIITFHGGTIKVDNRPGEGVTFHILLPLTSLKLDQS